ncbi:hypothetical protein [Scytonema sp. NUACC26]|uniref:hypothetical protein n=1 Tax=Scytonema sp. NUACC26 TaxID=3140176 RepID=UPI0034DB8708
MLTQAYDRDYNLKTKVLPTIASGIITSADSASSEVTGASNQKIITGTPTTGSVAAIAGTGYGSFSIQVSGTFAGILQFEKSVDGVIWNPATATNDAGFSGTSTTANGTFFGNFSASSNFRVRAISLTSGSANIALALTTGSVSQGSSSGGSGGAITANLTANLAASGATYVIDFDQYQASAISIQIGSGHIALVNFEVSNDNTNWYFCRLNSSSFEGAVSSTSTNGLYTGNKQARYFRLRLTSYSSGTVIANINLFNDSSISIPSSIALNDSWLGFVNSFVGAASLLSAGANYIRWRSPNVANGAGLGRGFVATGTESIQLIANRTATGNGSTINLGSTYKDFQIQLSLNSGTLTALSIEIQISVDSNKWGTVATFTDIADGGILFLLNTPTQYIRANTNTLTGTSPNISLNLVGC